MASYHLSVKIISRSSGRSAVASASYRSRAVMIDERQGMTFDYSKKQLGMTFASNVRTLRLDGPLLAEGKEADGRIPVTAPQGEGWFYFFLEKAMAGE